MHQKITCCFLLAALWGTVQAQSIKGDVDAYFRYGKALMQAGKRDSADLVFKNIIDKYPKYRDAYWMEANLQLSEKNTDEALCYIDDGLYYFPADEELALKKFAILQTYRDQRGAEAQGQRLLDDFGEDSTVWRTYVNYKIEAAGKAARAHNYTLALYDYQKALEIDPSNPEALGGELNMQLRSGNTEGALDQVNSGLEDNPSSYALLMKKVSLLEEMRRYPEAIGTLQVLLKKYPEDEKARRLNIDLRMEAGRYFMSTDPYLQFQSVLEADPSDREALDYVINLAVSRGLNGEALAWVNRALRYYPRDQALLLKKMGILESLQKFTQAADIAAVLWRSDPGLREQFEELRIASGRAFMNELEYDSALRDFGDVLGLDAAQPAALNYSINILGAEKNYDSALSLLDRALAFYPGDEGLTLKKAGLLQQDERYSEAAALLEGLAAGHPDNPRYRGSLTDIALLLGRQAMQAQDYDAAYAHFLTVLRYDPSNAEALATLVNVELARDGQADSALRYAETGLRYYPESKDFLLKKAAALEALHRFADAYAITGAILRRYPYNTRIRNQYADERLAAGRAFRDEGQADSALREFREALAVRPRDSLALYSSINLFNTMGDYDSALVLIDRGLRYYPGNEYLTLKRAVVLENEGRYAEAEPAADSAAHMDPSPGNLDYALYLRSKSYRNALGLTYLSSHFDSLESANIATLQYLRYTRNGSSFNTKLNFAGRSIGTGIQVEEEVYYTHDSLWSSYADAALANTYVFPRVRLAYSLFRTFDKAWQVELGLRYLYLDSLSATSVVASLARYYGDFWVNARGYLIVAAGQRYYAGVLTARQYLDNRTDYLYGAIGAGNTPDQFSRNYQLAANLGSQEYSIGAGYQKVFSYRNVLNIGGTWYNQQIAPGRFQNQYDLSLTFLRKF